MPTARARTRSTDERGPGTGDGKAVITLTPQVAAVMRRMGSEMGGVSSAEVVRRSLHVLNEILRLNDDEELVVRNRRTNDVERLRFSWEPF